MQKITQFCHNSDIISGYDKSIKGNDVSRRINRMKKITPATLKLLFIGFVIILLCIANGMITGKMEEREKTYRNAKESISISAGESFRFRGIRIAVPYEEKDEVMENGQRVIKTSRSVWYYNADKIRYDADLESEIRTLGIYQSPVYTGKLSVSGSFVLPDFENTDTMVYFPEEAQLLIMVRSASLLEKPDVVLNGVAKKGSFYANAQETGVSFPVDAKNRNLTFSTELCFRGADKFRVNLDSAETVLNVQADWPSPGFTGFSYLPDVRNLTDDGFSASWHIPFATDSESIGFSFVEPVNLYQKLHRAQNYAFLFIIVPFIVLFLLEIFSELNLHPVNYLLCGAASVLFFLLLLSLSEHIQFVFAYLLGALASGLLVSLYVASITGKYKLGSVMCGVFLLMYSYLFFCLQSEDYALLSGSVFAFILLAVIMFVTRRVNWSNLKKQPDTDLIEE